MGLYLGGLIIGRISVSEIWGAYFWKGLFGGGGSLLSEFYGIFKLPHINRNPGKLFIQKFLTTSLFQGLWQVGGGEKGQEPKVIQGWEVYETWEKRGQKPAETRQKSQHWAIFCKTAPLPPPTTWCFSFLHLLTHIWIEDEWKSK